MKLAKLIPSSIVLVLFLVTINARAALIDGGSYVSDTVSGLDWLKLTQTINRSYDDISSQLGGGGQLAGWQYASGQQFDALLLDQGLIADSGCPTGTSFCGGVDPANHSAINSLVNLIGDTFELAYNNGVLTSNANASLGLLSDASIDGSSHYVGLLVGSYLSDTPYANTHYGDPQQNGSSATHIGSFLVRPSVVPIPAAIWLFGSGLIGLTGISRRKFQVA